MTLHRTSFYIVAYDDDLVSIEEIIETINGTGHNVISAAHYDEDILVDAGPDQTVYEGDTVALDGSRSSKPIGEFLSFEWSQTQGTAVILSDTKAARPSFDAPDVSAEGESLEFRLAYTDTAGTEYADTTAVLVMNSPVTAHIEMTSQEARDMIEANPDAVVIDVREETEYCSIGGHVPSSLNYPWNSGVFQEAYTEFPDNVPILIVCRSGNRSHQAANYLDSLGFSNVYDIGGMNTWEWEVELCEGTAPLSVTMAPEMVNGTVPHEITFSATAEGGMEPYFYAWDFGDGTTDDHWNPTHTYSNPGVYTAQLSVTDATGTTEVRSATVTVDGNTGPIADAGPDADAGQGETVMLDGSGSTDQDGDSLTYAWSQSESDEVMVSITGSDSPNASFTVPNGETGGYSLRFGLTVTDEHGLASADEVIVNIASSDTGEGGDGSSCFIGVLGSFWE